MDLLPTKIQHYVEGLNYASDDIGMSKAQVRIYDDFVLKVEKERPKLAKMVEVTHRSRPRLSVPKGWKYSSLITGASRSWPRIC